ncbi:hypothetical protein CUMW_162550 [Citrus unshiu]|nr:hypothetical protein CUMW_162550 [Citrus unshiu]
MKFGGELFSPWFLFPMGNDNDDKCVFPLTSLQIGDLQSYLSDLSLFLALESNKFYILVDNRPWLRDIARRERKEGKDSCSKPAAIKSKKLERWFSLIDAATLSRKRVLLPVKTLRSHLLLSSELHRTLYGFIVFEVAWTNVRGINYLNELQTDTSLAIEAKFMQRWEFDSIAQAASCISSWFSGTLSEQFQLKEYLDSAAGEIFYDAEEDFSRTKPVEDDGCLCPDNQCGKDTSLNFTDSQFGRTAPTEDRTSEPHTPPPTGPYKRRKVTRCMSSGVEVDVYTEATPSDIQDSSYSSDSHASECKTAVEASQYCDVLILFRFNDRDLPFKLRQVIMFDLRLLTLLEAGLPSWVIFLQSYPGFCHLYRPWMCPLARALYVMISVVTVLIGFYDLYKNVPVLKATVSRLFGPLFDWIETWEMVSRIKYLGTMLFLHNFQKAVEWFLAIARTFQSFFSVVTQPLAATLTESLSFLLPIWNMFIQVARSFCSVVGVIIDSSSRTSVLYPIFWTLWEILYSPIRIFLALGSFGAFIFASISELMGDIWQTVSSIFQLASASEATVTTYEVSMWRSLWNDLFSQVFRAVRSILNGFVAFFAACNRHRLSIYNHIQDFIQRLLGQTKRSQYSDSRHNRATQRGQNLSEVRRIHIK